MFNVSKQAGANTPARRRAGGGGGAGARYPPRSGRRTTVCHRSPHSAPASGPHPVQSGGRWPVPPRIFQHAVLLLRVDTAVRNTIYQTKLARTAPALCRACRFLLLLADASSLASAWLQSDSSQSSSTSSPAPYLPVQHNCISDVVLHDYFAEFDHTVHAVPGGGSAPSGTAAPPYTTPLASPCSKPCIAVRNSMSTALFTSYTLYGSPHHQHCTPRVSRVFLCKIRNTFLCVATVTQG